METLPEINLAVLGASRVGKSSFIKHSFDLVAAPSTPIVARRLPIDGNTYVVRLVELHFDDVEIEGDNAITWPSTIESRRIPKIDGVLTLYDVSDRTSFKDVPEIISEFFPCLTHPDYKTYMTLQMPWTKPRYLPSLSHASATSFHLKGN